MTTAVLAQLATLPKMNLKDLRALWANLYKTPCPNGYNCRYLVKILAHRIQILALGGDSENTKARLDDLASRYYKDNKHCVAALMTGTVLTREYQGVEHQVLVLEDGQFQYDGCKYKSLSAVARRITGTQWNGYVFFGLKKR